MDYTRFLRDYESQDHMTRIGVDDNSLGAGYFMSGYLHPVLKPSTDGFKVLVVFNASQSTLTEVSLNDVLQVGSRLQGVARSIVALTDALSRLDAADIGQMFHQIHVHPQDRFLQKILWRESPHKPIGCYRLNTVTYGTV